MDSKQRITDDSGEPQKVPKSTPTGTNLRATHPDLPYMGHLCIYCKTYLGKHRIKRAVDSANRLTRCPECMRELLVMSTAPGVYQVTTKDGVRADLPKQEPIATMTVEKPNAHLLKEIKELPTTYRIEPPTDTPYAVAAMYEWTQHTRGGCIICGDYVVTNQILCVKHMVKTKDGLRMPNIVEFERVCRDYYESIGISKETKRFNQPSVDGKES